MKRLILMCVAVAVGAALAPGCGGRGSGGTGGASGGSGGSSGGGSGGSGDRLNSEELDATDRGGDASNGIQQLTTLADSLFDFDPTIDTAKTAAENAQAVEQRLVQNLGSPDGGVVLDGGMPGCGTVTLSANTVTAAFGAPPGCTLKNGVRVSGTVSVSVMKVLNTISLSLTMTNMTVNGKALSGTATFATTTGTSFTVNADVTSGSTRYQVNMFSVSGTAGSATFDGMASVTSGNVTTAMTFNTVVWNKGDCYPSSGTLQARKGSVTATITFSSVTATTGQISVSTGRVTTTGYLPAYGSCGVRDGG